MKTLTLQSSPCPSTRPAYSSFTRHRTVSPLTLTHLSPFTHLAKLFLSCNYSSLPSLPPIPSFCTIMYFPLHNSLSASLASPYTFLSLHLQLSSPTLLSPTLSPSLSVSIPSQLTNTPISSHSLCLSLSAPPPLHLFNAPIQGDLACEDEASCRL